MRSNVWNETNCEVMHEEVVTHSPVNRKVNGWRGEARVIVHVVINGNDYEANQVITLRFKPSED